MVLYGAAKAAVVVFARTLALEEAANGIMVNVIEPGDIRGKEADRAAARAVAARNLTGHAGRGRRRGGGPFRGGGRDGFLNGMVLGVNGGLAEPHE